MCDQQDSRTADEELFERSNAINVEMVGRLVQ